MITKNPETGKRNVGCYRMQVFDERTTGMHWQTQKHGAEHFRSARSKNPKGTLDVAVAIGADPATCLAGILPVPPDLDEFLFSGFLRREPVELVTCKTVDLEVPANAEIVLEGYVELGELRTEGPFGDHTGFYSLEGQYPVFHVQCITHRKEPMYLTTIVGPPPQEDYFIGHAIERVFLPVMKMQHAEIVDVAMPAEGIFQNLMIVAIKKSYPGQARKIMNAIWSLGQAMFTKVVVVVDHDVDVQNSSEVVWKALCAIDPERDIQFVLGPVDTLDHAARLQDFGSKMGIDATRKWPEEGYAGRWPDEIKMDEATKKRVDALWHHLKIETSEEEMSACSVRARSVRIPGGAMKKTSVLMAVSLCVLLTGASRALAQSRPALSPEVQRYVRVSAPVVALTHVRVLDGTGSAPKENQTVIISGDKMQSVGDASAASIPAGAQALDLTGYTVIPGLVGHARAHVLSLDPRSDLQRDGLQLPEALPWRQA